MDASIAQANELPLEYVDKARLVRLQREVAAEGRCTRPGTDPERWFPVEPSPKATTKRREYEWVAKIRCNGCRAKTRCLLTALAEEKDLPYGDASGIRGGKAPWQRDEIRRNASNNAGVSTEEAA
ncbi:hypothetical protein AB0C10_15655 [Microbispora amethystogenes]|uniref:hypothetical protein n=1 Tax=Microbispora amethystogenes TaxID=1427754 RepID=UPI0033C5C57D